MKRKILFAFLLGMFPFSAQALPVCQPATAFAKYISRWQKNDTGAWQAEFICEDRRQAKLHAEDVLDPASNEGTFFIVDMKNILESLENFAEPCEALARYCSGEMETLSEETKAMLIEQMNAVQNATSATQGTETVPVR